jgi:DNA repair ATPase RecN
MAINLEKELKTISIQLKALSKRVDEIAGGIRKPRKSKQKFVFKRDASLTEVPIDKNDLEIKSDISTVSIQGVDDIESEVSPNLQM